jgi:hypothetical protein
MDLNNLRDMLRARLEVELGRRIGFTVEEASSIMGLAPKTLYNGSRGFRCRGKRLFSVDDILSELQPLKGKAK